MRALHAPDGLVAPECPPLEAARHGDRAAALARAAAAGLPVPPALALDADAVAEAATTEGFARRLATLEEATGERLGDPARPLLIAIRCATRGGGSIAPAVVGLGITPATREALAARLGARAVADLSRRAAEAVGLALGRIDPDEAEAAFHDRLKAAGAADASGLSAEDHAALEAGLRMMAEAGGTPLPVDPAEAGAAVVAAMRRAWDSPRAAMRREARGLDPDLPLALLLQRFAPGLGPEPSGAGVVTRRDEATGAVQDAGRFLAQAVGDEALMGLRTPSVLTAAERAARGLPTPSVEEAAPQLFAALRDAVARAEALFADSLTLDFAVEAGRFAITDIRPARRSARAALRLTVELAEAGVTDRRTALLSVTPAVLDEHLHPTLAPGAVADVVATGLAASPGAAAGPLVFSSDAAEAAAATGRRAILALTETGPEDIRGMHAAAGVLTVRGGMTSHAALVARGLGRPCVVGARDLVLDRARGALRARGGRVFEAGAEMTVDGSQGRVIAGAVPTRPPEITGAFAELIGWADAVRRIAVRANADTAQDAATARAFNAAGIGLCRTEHMFFKRGRISAMQEMILADNPEDRRAALAHLMPMQKGDFVDLFREMAGLPVVIRLLDPPLHEFLPHGAEETAELAGLLGIAPETVAERAASLAEFNPMLGRRGCRIGIAFPEIYEMQARAIFEAAIEAGAEESPVRPEIMIPLVSAVRELEVLRERIDAVAGEVSAAKGTALSYTVGVMIETPRACLRAGDIAASAEFLSFGTNDLTQMLYGLSRDDAGRFMPDYVSQGVFPHDPFHRIDEEGVGEIIRIAISRARAARPDVTIGLCGEHGGDPDSIDFCERAGFDYISCSPYRVPIARLAGAQASLRGAARGSGGGS